VLPGSHLLAQTRASVRPTPIDVGKWRPDAVRLARRSRRHGGRLRVTSPAALVCCRSTALSYHVLSRKSTYISPDSLLESNNITAVSEFVTTPLTNPPFCGMLPFNRTLVLCRAARQRGVSPFACGRAPQPRRRKSTLSLSSRSQEVCHSLLTLPAPRFPLHTPHLCATFSFTPALGACHGLGAAQPSALLLPQAA
jgi:hypothetical protein